MKGDSEDPCPKIIKTPTIKSIIINGSSHHFFLTLKKFKNSKINGLFLIVKFIYLLFLNILQLFQQPL